MKLLFLAPQPFFQERGTPIAVRLVLEVLSSRAEDDFEIDLVTYHEGETLDIPGVALHRIWAPPWIKNIGPGISWKKLFCDLVFFFTTLKLVWRNRHARYELVHAVEESVFIAWFLRVLFRIPYVYDMDSSLALQVTEKWTFLKWCRPVLEWLERGAIQSSIAVVPVCDALASIAITRGAPATFILRDVSLLDATHTCSMPTIRAELGLTVDDKVVLYIGNLEGYQGIDLLLESFVRARTEYERAHLVIIGGVDKHIAHYKRYLNQKYSLQRIHFLGPRSIDLLNFYILQADILVSPRIKGNNTPMKIYSYLHSGRPILATAIESHKQVLDSEVSFLADPAVEPFARGIVSLLHDEILRTALGKAARERAERLYTFEVFQDKLNDAYDLITARIAVRREATPRFDPLRNVG